MWALHVKIYESEVGDAYPVVEHVFRGKTKAEAQGYYESHLKTDTFLRNCVEKSRWRDVNCYAVAYWARR
jgi:hypothetical protein